MQATSITMAWGWSIRAGLVLDVLADDFEWRPASGEEAVGSGPEDRLTVVGSQVLREVTTQQAGGNGFQIVDQFRERGRGLGLEQKMDMVRLAIGLDQPAVPVLAQAACDRREARQLCSGARLFPCRVPVSLIRK